MFALALLLVLLAPAPAQRAFTAGDATFAELVQRDASLGFTARSAVAAAADLAGGALEDRARAEALLALGLGGARREQPRLESSALEGTLEERCAAVLALGFLGGGVRARLVELMGDPEPEVAECALLAALILDPQSMRERVDRIAAEAEGLRADEARRILLYSIDAGSAPPSRAVRRLLELRYGAARRYGLIEGQPLELLLMGRLVADQGFLDQVVLRGAAELGETGVSDQLLGHLLEHGGEAALRGAARGMPDALAEFVGHGFLSPSPADWGVILAELGRDRRPQGAQRLIATAHERLPGNLVVIELLARIGELGTLAPLAEGQARLGPAQQIEAAAVWGASASPLAAAPLRELSRSEDRGVRAAALLNRARLGDAEALAAVRAVLFDPAHADWPLLVGLARRFAHDVLLQDLLEQTLSILEPGPSRLALAASLVEQGRAGGLEVLRAELARDGLPAGPEGLVVARALSRRGSAETRDLLAGLLPVEDRPAVNAELALGLVRARDAAVLPILRAALWSDPFERSLLAAALVLHVGGRHTLRQELDRVPTRATSRDLRRVGFAMGYYGGVEEVRWLSARRGAGSGDPAVQGAYLGALAARTF